MEAAFDRAATYKKKGGLMRCLLDEARYVGVGGGVGGVFRVRFRYSFVV